MRVFYEIKPPREAREQGDLARKSLQCIKWGKVQRGRERRGALPSKRPKSGQTT